MQKPIQWRRAAIKAIEKRQMLRMKWELSLAVLSQPTFDPEASHEKAQAIQDIYGMLSGEEEEEENFVPMDDSDTIALLAMAGRYPVRTIDAGSGNTS